MEYHRVEVGLLPQEQTKISAVFISPLGPQVTLSTTTTKETKYLERKNRNKMPTCGWLQILTDGAEAASQSVSGIRLRKGASFTVFSFSLLFVWFEFSRLLGV